YSIRRIIHRVNSRTRCCGSILSFKTPPFGYLIREKLRLISGRAPTEKQLARRWATGDTVTRTISDPKETSRIYSPSTQPPMFERFTVIPAIDLKTGAVVRLHQGDMARATVYGTDPAAVARTFEKQGAELIHIVDLDGATAGAPRNLDAVRAIRHATSCQLDISGGLRTLESVRAIIGAGAGYISIGSAALL